MKGQRSAFREKRKIYLGWKKIIGGALIEARPFLIKWQEIIEFEMWPPKLVSII